MNTIQTFRRYLATILLSLLLSGCALGPPPGVVPISGFELQRYLGHWYEIARLDHSFERGMTDISAHYRLREDNSVEVINRGHETAKDRWREAVGTARLIGEPTRGSLKVSFFGPFYGGYHIAALDPDYRWSLVIGPDTSYAWVLARDKILPAGIREQLVQQAAAVGIDTSALIWVEHTRE
ncbi:MAG: lipocalin family protein [Rhodocyclaceae bacterium]|nr:lipocalin family protein [Rhodocyclaceae bacterium]